MKNVGRVAVCDRDAAARAFVSEIARSIGYDVIEASNGRQALATLLVGDVQIGFIDLSLPELSGIEVGHRVLKARLRPILVAISGDMSIREQTLAHGVGFDAFLRRPVGADPVTAILQGHQREAAAGA